ncbi:MAG: hypothetical protein ACKVHP_09685, partial [Verrucomicrobiales bacterium]
MINKEFVERDLQLKHYATRPRVDDQHRYNWADGHQDESDDEELSGVELELDGINVTFSRQELADELGQALTDVLRSRDEKNIYSQENRVLVTSLVKAVLEELTEHSQRIQSGNVTAAREEVSRSIERALVNQDAYDIAKSFIQRHQQKDSPFHGLNGYSLTTKTKLIRRNGLVVPWNPTKIEVAVSKAF